MTHSITLEVPGEVYDVLEEAAKERGQSPAVVAAELLATASQYLTADPLGSLKPTASKRRRNHKRITTEEDRQAFLSSAGGWSDVDVEAFKEYIRESRQISTRPEIDL